MSNWHGIKFRVSPAVPEGLALILNGQTGGGGGAGPTPTLKTITAPATEPTDPTPDQLLEWVADEIGGFDWEFGTYDEMKSIAQRIIDTVKSVTG